MHVLKSRLSLGTSPSLGPVFFIPVTYILLYSKGHTNRCVEREG